MNCLNYTPRVALGSYKYILFLTTLLLACNFFVGNKVFAQTTKLPNLDSTLNKLDDKQLQKYAQSVGSNTQALSNKVKAANEKELADM